MDKEPNVNIIVSNILNENRYSCCRLCLKNVQENYSRFQDFVTLDSNAGDFQELSEVLTNLLGPEICEDIVGLDAVCFDCVNKALAAEKFIISCKKSTETLHNVLENLTNTLDITLENVTPEHKLYITVGEHESKLALINSEAKLGRTGKTCLFYCNDCEEKLGNSEDFKEHNITKHGYLTCDKCYYTSSNEEEIIPHIFSEEMFECTKCKLQSCTEDSMREHQQCHDLYICQECGKSCIGLDKLKAHELKHVSKNECPKCGKCYNTKEFFLKHVKLCLEDLIDPHPMRSKIKKTYFCDKCDKGYSTPGGLRVHERFVHGNAKPHVCKYCGKQFTAPSYLRVHLIKHTGEKNFKCELCTRKFVSKEALLYHTRRHTGEKPYSCTMCDEKFVNSSARAEHIKFKHVGPTLMCEICSRKFVTATFLKQHMKKHHDPSNKLYTGRSLIPPNVPAVENMRVRFID